MEYIERLEAQNQKKTEIIARLRAVLTRLHEALDSGCGDDMGYRERRLWVDTIRRSLDGEVE